MADELTLLEMAEALDKMDRDLNSWESEFHNSVLEVLRFGSALTEKQTKKLKEIYERYLGEDAGVDETIDDVDY